VAFVKVASVNDLQDGQVKTVSANGKDLALSRVEGKFYAVDNTCPHRQGPLGDGELDGKNIMCPLHAKTFDVSTGSGVSDPALKVACFKTKVEGEDVLVDV